MDRSPPDADWRIVVTIPTFRRPVLLRRLLGSLRLLDRPALIIVADNDCGDDAPRAVEALCAEGQHAICIPVRERGLTSVRNALVEAAYQHAPDWEWLALIDDDGMLVGPWLDPMIRTAQAHQAVAVGGPVYYELPAVASRLARQSGYACERQSDTGPVTDINSTQNTLLSRRLEDLMPRPWFGTTYALSGGEDYDLFRRIANAGGRLAWCREARIHEATPPERLTARALLYRSYSSGMYCSRIDSTYDGWPSSLLFSLRGLAGATFNLARHTVAWQLDAAARSLDGVAYHSGRLAGLSGFTGQRYRT